MNVIYISSVAVMIAVNVLFFILFERMKPKPKDILPIVVICCGASLGRVVFNVVPQVQPVTALVIVAGSVYGCRKGYVTGALCALVSNLFLGQGPWTLFQMTAWGMVGFLAGLLEKVLEANWGDCGQKCHERKRAWVYAVFGFGAAFLFSIITDFSTIAYLGDNITWESVLAVYVTGLAFNIGHGIFNFVLLLFLYGTLSRKLYRVRKKGLSH